MKLATPYCPDCGRPARGTLERVVGVAEFATEPAPDGEVDFFGETEIWWDEQCTMVQDESKPRGPDNLPMVCCAQGHEWPCAIGE